MAAQCRKAFVVTSVMQCSHHEVQEELNMCSLYLPQKTTSKLTPSLSIAELWKDQPRGSPGGNSIKELATYVLGEDLVTTFTKDLHHPPDVSL